MAEEGPDREETGGGLANSRARRMQARVEDARRSVSDWAKRRGGAKDPARDGYLRQTFCLPRDEARIAARQFLDRFPKAAYASEVESWRALADGRIEFTMRRLPTAD